MVEPVSMSTLALISIGTSAAAGGVGALGALSGGKAQSDMYKYQAGIASINKKIAEQNADYALKVGEVEAQRSGMQTSFKIASEKTAQAASGVDINTGNAAAVRESEREIGFQDETVIRANAERKAYSHQLEAMEATAKGTMATMAASGAETAGYINAASSILGGVSSVSGKWMQAQQYGMLGGTKSAGDPGPYQPPSYYS
jgi:hypothetical protein